MALTRSATIQVRVVPLVKKASEAVLTQIGFTMSEAIELFLRRVIIDEKIPFDLVTLQEAQFNTTSPGGERTIESPALDRSPKFRAAGVRKKKLKKILSTRTPTQIPHIQRLKN
jgi:addiction module RelB/DinJ family antitoxin